MPAPPRGEFNNITLTRNPDYFFTQREVVPLRKMTTPLTIAQQGGLRSLGARKVSEAIVSSRRRRQPRPPRSSQIT